jgi:ABC-2 type transport system ATP-binding protein
MPPTISRRGRHGRCVWPRRVRSVRYLPELDELDATIAVAKSGRVVVRGSRAELLAGLPGELSVRFAGRVPAEFDDRGHIEGDTLRTPTISPTRDLTTWERWL